MKTRTYDSAGLEEERQGVRSTTPEVWAKLKPLARLMRHEPTPAENALWQRLRNRKVANTKFRRQHAIGRYIVDFYAASANLIIEVDGPIHDSTQEQDAIRQEWLESQGLRVIRFTNEQVLQNIETVLTTIEATLTEVSPSPGFGEGTRG